MPHSVQNFSLFLHLLVGVVAPARLVLHTHTDPPEKDGRVISEESGEGGWRESKDKG